MLYPFNKEILKSFFIKIKEEVNLKADVELYAEISETEEGLIVGTDISLDDPLVTEINANVGDRVIVKAKIPTDANFTVEDAELLNRANEYFDDLGGLDSVLTSDFIASSLDDAATNKIVSADQIIELKSVYLKDKKLSN